MRLTPGAGMLVGRPDLELHAAVVCGDGGAGTTGSAINTRRLRRYPPGAYRRPTGRRV